MTSSHMTKTTTSTLDEEAAEVEEKKETVAQLCFDRTWYSLSCSARFDRVIMAALLPWFIRSGRPRAGGRGRGIVAGGLFNLLELGDSAMAGTSRFA